MSKDKDLHRRARRSLEAAGLAASRLVIVRSEPLWQVAPPPLDRPCLVILDDEISPGNGPRLLGDLHRRLVEVLVVYVAAQHSVELERTVRQLGVLYYIAKPPDWEVLHRVLASVLSASTASSNRSAVRPSLV